MLQFLTAHCIFLKVCTAFERKTKCISIYYAFSQHKNDMHIMFRYTHHSSYILLSITIYCWVDKQKLCQVSHHLHSNTYRHILLLSAVLIIFTLKEYPTLIHKAYKWITSYEFYSILKRIYSEKTQSKTFVWYVSPWSVLITARVALR